MGEGLFHEFAHAMALAGRKHVIVGLVLLQHEPHAFDVIAGVPPIAATIKISDVQTILQTKMNRRNSPRNFPGDKCLAAAGSFVVEQNAI